MRARRCLLLALLATLVVAGSAQAYSVSITRTAHGIPHLEASDWGSLAYGYGYVTAQDNICVVADTYVTSDAQRSRYFGPDKSYSIGGNGTAPNNLNSDFFWQRIIDKGVVERLVAQEPPLGPKPEVIAAIEGYAAGYNRFLSDIGGVDNISDPTCRGAAWVHPITPLEVYRRFYALDLLASQGVAVDGIGNAAPAVSAPAAAAATARQQKALATTPKGKFDDLLGGIGSNAVALGSEATTDGGGLLLGNPHFPWYGSERFYETQLTIPGELDVAGASLLGVPAINIGFTRGLAWSHTVSTARRFTIFQLALAPHDPTTYLVDGTPTAMDKRTVTVDVKQADGSIKPQSRTLYETKYGPMITSILGLPLFPWTPASGFAMGDANADNFGRLLNHFFDVDRAQSVDELKGILRRYEGIPWVNTIAADSSGHAYYADIGSMPNVSNSKIQTCSTPIGLALDQAQRVQVLDGARSSCNWDTDADAPAPGLFGPSHQPDLERPDYVTNSNDSYWLSNPAHPLEGFSHVIGDERTARSPRTRLGLRIVQQRLDGSDDEAGTKFDSAGLMKAVFNDRQFLGEQWRNAVVGLCSKTPTMIGSNGPVDVTDACAALAGWDLHDNLDSRGALLFRRFASRVTNSAAGQAAWPWLHPFDAGDPVNTPNGLNSADPRVQQALADAVTDLHGAGIPLNAPLGDWQYVTRNGTRIPIHGGPGTLGVFNAMNVGWNAQKGYPDVPHGSSYVQVVAPRGPDACPDAHTILTYSESTDPTSPWFSDQTPLYSQKQWIAFPFCAADVQAQAISTQTLSSP